MTDSNNANTPTTDDTTPSYANDPMYLATVAHKEITDLVYQIDRLAARYDHKDGVEARLVTELLKIAGHTLDWIRFSDLHEVQKANPAKVK